MSEKWCLCAKWFHCVSLRYVGHLIVCATFALVHSLLHAPCLTYILPCFLTASHCRHNRHWTPTGRCCHISVADQVRDHDHIIVMSYHSSSTVTSCSISVAVMRLTWLNLILSARSSSINNGALFFYSFDEKWQDSDGVDYIWSVLDG